MTQTIERGSVEHLRFVVEAHQDTLRMVHTLAADVRRWLAEGDQTMAEETLAAIETVTRGYEKAHEAGSE